VIFILDTNVLSAMMQVAPEPAAAAWMAGQDEALLFTTAISYSEVFAGIAVLAGGRRRRALEQAAHGMFDEFDGRVLAFDTDAAVAYADLFAVRQRAGRPAGALDLMIAAIAACHDATVVTRDVRGFEECGVGVVNPWEGL
jgi:predicted nucleic acid-binding protein